MARAIDCKTCLHEKVCDLWMQQERQDASCFCQDGCDYFTPTFTPLNEPLTLAELREMDEPTPVWWKKAGLWCLCERGFIIAPNGNIYEFEETDGTFYRRPPEEEI